MNEITITINGVEYIAKPKGDVETVAENKPKTGYERVDYGEDCFCISPDGKIEHTTEEYFPFNDGIYETANYCSDEIIAENNARADRLMRKLRQWQALNDKPVDWLDETAGKYAIFCDYKYVKDITLYAVRYHNTRQMATIYFSTEEKALEAIDVFYGELTWYFTEYMQRLDEPR